MDNVSLYEYKSNFKIEPLYTHAQSGHGFKEENSMFVHLICASYIVIGMYWMISCSNVMHIVRLEQKLPKKSVELVKSMFFLLQNEPMVTKKSVEALRLKLKNRKFVAWLTALPNSKLIIQIRWCSTFIKYYASQTIYIDLKPNKWNCALGALFHVSISMTLCVSGMLISHCVLIQVSWCLKSEIVCKLLNLILIHE